MTEVIGHVRGKRMSMFRANNLSRRRLLRGVGVLGLGGVAAAALAGCGETQIVEVVKEVPVEKIVTREVEKIVVQEKIVTQVVEKIVTAGPVKLQAGSIKLQVAHTWDPARTPEQVAFDNKFMDKHPEYDITVTYAPWGEHNDKWLPHAAARTLPDITYSDDTWVGMWAKLGLFVRLNDYINNQPDFDFDDFVPAHWAPASIQGHIYGIGFDWNGPAIGWNMRMFEEKGVEGPNDDWTYEDQFLEAALKLTDADAGVWGFDIVGWANWPWHGNYLVPWGAELVDESETATTINSPEGQAAVQFWVDLRLKHKVAPNIAEQSAFAANPFAMGRVAMRHWPPWGTPGMLELNPELLEYNDIFKQPKGPVRRAAPACGSKFSITRDAKEPDAAWVYLNEYMGKENQEFMWSCRGTAITTRLSAQPCFLTAPNLPKSGKIWVDMGVDYAVACLPLSPSANEMLRVSKELSDGLFLGDTDVPTFTAELEKQLLPLLAENEGP